MAVAFLEATDTNSVDVARSLKKWVELGDKVTVVAVVIGEREQVEKLSQSSEITYPVLWDFEMYVAPIWAVSAVPTLFLIDSQGLVLGRVIGSDPEELEAARLTLEQAVQQSEEAAKAAAAAEAAAKVANQAPQAGGAPGPVAAAPAPTNPSTTAPAKN